MLVQTIHTLQKNIDFSGYTYFGFGGPFLEDLRLINYLFPKIKLVSIEKNAQTRKRQEFHCFTKDITLSPNDFSGFIAKYRGAGKEIFWLDYTDLAYQNFVDFMSTLNKAGANSIIKISLRAQLEKEMLDEEYRKEQVAKFIEQYGEILPSYDIEEYFLRQNKYMSLIMEMLRIASEKILPTAGGVKYQLLAASYYSDQTTMLSITGIKCESGNVESYRDLFKDSKLANLDWTDPNHIDLPFLSFKERFKLENHLGLDNVEIDKLAEILGYRIDESTAQSKRRLQNYSDFHHYYPQFVRILY